MISPIMENRPLATQTMRLRLTLPVDWRTPVGDTKMPLPMMQPTMMVQPLRRVSSAFMRTPSPSLVSPVSCFSSSGVSSLNSKPLSLVLTSLYPSFVPLRSDLFTMSQMCVLLVR